MAPELDPAGKLPGQTAARWGLAGLTAALGSVAALLMFSVFRPYDDEGYVLFSYANFAREGGLYGQVYSQYGPLPYVLSWLAAAVGLPLNHQVGRGLALLAWIGAALSCALVVGTAVRSGLARLAVLAGVFVYLAVMSHEPMHPGGLITLIVALVALAGYRAVVAGNMSRWALLAGATTSALLLTKINVGVFAAYSLLLWWALHHRAPRWRRWLTGLCFVSVIVVPLALFRPLLATPWVQVYAIVFAAGGGALLLACQPPRPGATDLRTLGVAVTAACVVALLVSGTVIARGTTPQDLLDGMIIGPLRHPLVFSMVFPWPQGLVTTTGISFAACCVAHGFRARHARQVDTFIAIARLLIAALVAVQVCRFPAVSPEALIFSISFPSLWVWAWRCEGEEPARASGRAWIAVLLLGQCLHPFPVPGSQIAWGSFLSVPLVAMSAWDAAGLIRSRWLRLRARVPLSVVARVAVGAFIGIAAWQMARESRRFRDGESLGLPGASAIQLPARAAALLRVSALNAAVHADVLFSLPGMFSFNLWTGLPAPTLANTTHWFSLLDHRRQQAIVDALRSTPRASVIVDRAHLAFLAQRGLFPGGVLHDYLQENFQPAFVVGQYEFHVHRGRSVRPYMLAAWLTRRGPDPAGPAENTLVTFAAMPLAGPVATITLLPDNSAGPALVLHAKNCRARIAPLTRLTGAPAAADAAWPLSVIQPSEMVLYFDVPSGSGPPVPGTLILRDNRGAEIGLARLQ